MIKLKQRTINIFLYVLISLESIYIGSVYVPVYGIQGVIAALIYASIAVVHIYAPSKRLSFVVLLISIGIAIPRLLLTIEHRIDERRSQALVSIQLEEGRELAPEKPTLNECSKLPSWEGARMKDCQDQNNKLQSEHLERISEHKANLREYQEQRTNLKTSVPLTLSDYGSMIMFMILSGSLPAVIYLLLVESSELGSVPEVTSTREKEKDLMKEALDLYYNNVPVVEILRQYEGQFSRTTFYKYLKAKK